MICIYLFIYYLVNEGRAAAIEVNERNNNNNNKQANNWVSREWVIAKCDVWQFQKKSLNRDLLLEQFPTKQHRYIIDR